MEAVSHELGHTLGEQQQQQNLQQRCGSSKAKQL
jgi:hypothetical protein